MKHLSILVALLISFSFSSLEKKTTYTLTVQVDNLRNSDGVVLFLLYDNEDAIPDKHTTKYYKKLSSNIVSNKASITFTGLSSKTYAVNIIHDENNNGEIDMGFMLPSEGVGFSNYKKLNIMNRPNFSKASFELDSDMTVTVKTIYM